jgi:hypothetical protein
MAQPDVDHIIAVHDLRRPITRAVGSVLDGTRCSVRVTVVCHNLDPAGVAAALGTRASDPRVRLLAVADGVASPSGPFNAGLEAATGRFTSIMGSDDELETGAIDSWLRIADETRSDVVIARVVVLGRGPVFTPPVRPGRTKALDGVRDRLAYRSAPLGLVARDRFGSLRFPVGLRSGEDTEYVTQLWYSRARIALDAHGPAYLVHEDAPSRVSTQRKSIRTDAAFLDGLLRGDAFLSLGPAQRDALVTKLLRGNILMWITYRPTPDMWSADDVRALGDVVRTLAEAAPRAFRPLSRTDRRILDAFTQTPASVETALGLIPGRTSPIPRNVLPRDLFAVLAREAPLRYGAASMLRARR